MLGACCVYAGSSAAGRRGTFSVQRFSSALDLTVTLTRRALLLLGREVFA
jgi:hypothetical protein